MRGLTAPVQVWEQAALEPERDLAGLLRVLGNERRLELLRLLAEGDTDAESLARRMRLPVPEVRGDLEVLAAGGLVQADGNAGTEVYQLAQHAVRLLGTTLSYGLREHPRPKKSASGRTTPLACTLCDNRAFVSNTISQLDAALHEARRYHGQIKKMSSQVLAAHEAERKRIARELHDDTAQALTSILVRLRLLERHTADSEVLKNVEELRDLTAGALDSVRRMAMDLRPAALDDLGLVPALQAYADRFSQAWPVKATVEVPGLKRRLPADVELVLYRVAQEALTNVAKHAGATKARVSLTRRHNEATLIVEDDGVGFEIGDVPRPNGTGLGLFGMRERLALVGGTAEIESATGKGTKITARVPLAGHGGRSRRTK